MLKIPIKTEKEIQTMKEGGEILVEILKELSGKVKPGITTWSLEESARRLIKEYPDTEPAFLGFPDRTGRKYPAALCVSLNEEIVHCLPSERKIMPGDLVTLDLGVKYQGLNVDSALTLLVEPEKHDPQLGLKNKLLKVTKESLEKGISAVKIGKTIGDISSAIQKHAEKNGFAVIKELVGHGIGYDLHENPDVPNFGEPGEGPKLLEGVVIAIEPMLSTGSSEIKEDKKTLAWKTKDGSLSAHFEHTVAITQGGPLILTST